MTLPTKANQYRAHRRQFVIGPAPILVDDEWTSTPIGKGFHLSHHQALPVATFRDRDGGCWYLLGIAVQTDPTKAAPPEEISMARSDEVDALPCTWSGRWVLVGGGVLRTDAGGLFGCFYARSTDGKLVMSSSTAILRDQIGEGDPSPPLHYRTGMEWYPPPASRFAGIRRLLPSQIFAYTDEDDPVRYRPLVSQHLETGYGETLRHIETSLRTALCNLAQSGGPALTLGLTGGFDTRVLLAAMWRERLDFTIFTWDIPDMSRADRVLPPLLARDAGLAHRFIERQHFAEQALRTLDEHTALHTVDRDRELIPWGQYGALGRKMVVAGNLFTLGALYFYKRLPPNPDSITDSIEHAFGFAEHHADSPAHCDGIREWVEWIEKHPEPRMDWRDRFFWEQWGAGWGAACEQAADLVEFECVSPVNSESILGAILRIEPAKRYNKRWQVDLAYRMAPFVTEHPYRLGGPFMGRFREGASGFVHHPSKRRFAIGRMKSLVGRVRTAPGSFI
jgi:hypothetical protein